MVREGTQEKQCGQSKERYVKVRNEVGFMKKQAKVTSKGQITVPREIRRRLGVRAGDQLLFEEDGEGVRVTAVRKDSPFAKYMGIGNPGIGKGKKALQKWMHDLRGHDEE
jgi:antitoxin PrlF